MIRFTLLFICITLAVVLNAEKKTCGYDACNPGISGMINVHIVCHTHDDVGWVMTLEQYYRGYVRDIINSVISNLLENTNRRFVYVEVAFFEKWWNEQTQLMKESVKELVNSGRLEFVGGGWVMNDEAVTHYEEIVDQMTTGNRWLNETFGECGIPKTIWQIDPFGHSREQASLVSQMGFDGLLLGRIDYQDIDIRKSKKRMEFYWEGSDTLEKTGVFTNILPNVYWPPKGFCFDVGCNDEEINSRNSDLKARIFIDIVQNQAKWYRSNHTIVTMGMDFYYRDASKWYRNLEQLMSAVNQLQVNGSKVNVFFSTPACYLKSVNSEDKVWEVEKSDFFPYASERHSYWTGYYTSRPSLKYYTRKAASFLQTCRQLTTYASMPQANITALKHAVAVLQHHDAITGTETQHVTRDYLRMLSTGITECQEEVKTAISRLMPNLKNSKELKFCDSLNQTECPITENENSFQLIVYNSLSREVKTFARLPVRGQGFTVHDASGQTLPIQISPIPGFLMQFPERMGRARYELVFPVDLPAMGATQFDIKRNDGYEPMDDPDSWVSKSKNRDGAAFSIQNEFYKIKVDTLTGLLDSVTVGQVEMPLRQNFHFYLSQPGFQNQKPSGAYSFNPYFDTPSRISANATITILKGDLVEEIWQRFSSWTSQVIRLYKGKPYVEFDWVVGPIPVKDYNGREVITKFDTGWKTDGNFYTDSNGRQSIKRIRNRRATWNLTVNEPIGGNYYPITAWAYIRDESKNLQMTLLTDRAQGASSTEDGSLEVMVHRRTLYDDGYGVNEALNELGGNGQGLVVRGKHWLVINKTDQSDKLIRQLAKELYHEPNFVFLPINETQEGVDAASNSTGLHFSSLTSPLPHNVHIMTIELLNHVEMLLRIENIYEEGDLGISSSIEVNLKNLFCAFQIDSIRETSLSAMENLKDVRKLKWRTLENTSQTNSSDFAAVRAITNGSSVAFETAGEFKVVLKPMQIKTFIVTLNRTLC